MSYVDFIWDLGGTLLDNYESSTQAFLETLEQFGVTASHDEVYAELKKSTAEAIAHFIPENEAFLPAYKAAEARYLEKPILFEGSIPFLEWVKKQKGRNFLISHRSHQVMSILEKLGILTYFTEVITSDNGFARKPDPESFNYLKDKYDISRAYVLGDRQIDVDAGQRAGFETILLTNNRTLVTVLESLKNE